MKRYISKEWRIIAQVAAAILCVHLLAYAELLLNADRFWPHTQKFLITVQWVLFHILAVLPFGMEFQSGSMGRLLSQPISRKLIWWRKVTPIFVFFTFFILLNSLLTLSLESWTLANISWGGWSGTYAELRAEWHKHHFLRMDVYFMTAAIVATCGGLCMSLYVRKLLASFWAALTIPLLIFVIFMLPLTHAHMGNWRTSDRMLLIIVGFELIYAAATYTLAYRRFMRLEV
jgi:hypothetical protein